MRSPSKVIGRREEALDSLKGTPTLVGLTWMKTSKGRRGVNSAESYRTIRKDED